VVDIDVSDTLSDAEQAEVVALHDAAAGADGYASLGDAVRRGIEPGHDGITVRSFRARDDHGRLVAYGAVTPADNADPPHVAAGIVVDPEARDDGVEPLLLRAMTDDVAARGGGRVIWWRVGADDRSDATAAANGYVAERDLRQMVVPLPLAESPQWPDGVDVRTFVPGRDDAEWLRVNNAAFAGHPEQGGWVQSTLDRRMREPWFDPKGLLLAFDREGLAGFCWTKIHEDEGVGEIYVIGVDPSRAGRRLGRPLVIAGLQWIAERGVPTGMLFVDAANERAVRLYESLGFTTRRTDRAYERTVRPGRTPGRARRREP
jgi:mycothiol synthase